MVSVPNYVTTIPLATREAWDEKLTQYETNDYVLSMLSRLPDVVDVGGAHIGRGS